MSLSDVIEQDFVVAYKAREQDVVSSLRLLKTAMKNRQVELGRVLEDADVIELLTRQVKQRQESIEQFRAASRNELADKEAREMAILQRYLPEPLAMDTLSRVVDECIASLGAHSLQDMGRVMQSILAEHKGQVDGKVLSGLVRQRLSR